jgi:hypothetical protein
LPIVVSPAGFAENEAFCHELEYYGLADAFFGRGWHVPGAMLAVGGWTDEGASRAVEAFLPDVRAWQLGPPVPQIPSLPATHGRCNTATTILGDNFFVVGGSFSSKAEALANCDVLSLTRKTWAAAAPMDTPRS